MYIIYNLQLILIDTHDLAVIKIETPNRNSAHNGTLNAYIFDYIYIPSEIYSAAINNVAVNTFGLALPCLKPNPASACSSLVQ